MSDCIMIHEVESISHLIVKCIKDDEMEIVEIFWKDDTANWYLYSCVKL